MTASGERASALATPKTVTGTFRLTHLLTVAGGGAGTGSMSAPKIVQIACCAIPGNKRTFANVYGLDDQSHVWQWNARDGRWEPNVIKPQSNGNRDASRDQWGGR